MDKDQQEQKRFLKEQVEWCKKQDDILEEIEEKLHDMKALAEYARDHELTSMEVDNLNDHLNALKRQIHSLEKQLHFAAH